MDDVNTGLCKHRSGNNYTDHWNGKKEKDSSRTGAYCGRSSICCYLSGSHTANNVKTEQEDLSG